MSSNDQDASTNENSGELNDQNSKPAKDKEGGPDIFSLDSIDDSWLDDKDDFSSVDSSPSTKPPGQRAQVQLQSNGIARGQGIDNLQKPAQLPNSSVSQNPINPNSQPVLPDSKFAAIQNPQSTKPPQLDASQPKTPQLNSSSSRESKPLSEAPPLPSPRLPELKAFSNQRPSRGSTLDTSDNLPSAQNPNLDSQSVEKVKAQQRSQQALQAKSMTEPVLPPGVPKQGVIPASSTNNSSAPVRKTDFKKDSSVVDDSALKPASVEGFHGWVQKSKNMRFHGEYRKLGGYSPAPQKTSPEVERSVANVAVQNLNNVEASPASVNSVSNEVPAQSDNSQVKAEESSLPLTEDLLSGNFKTPQSSKTKEPIHHEVGQPANISDEGLSISQMLKRDFQDDPLINGNLEQDFSRSNKSDTVPGSSAQPELAANVEAPKVNDVSNTQSKPYVAQINSVESKLPLSESQSDSSPSSSANSLEQNPNSQKFTKNNSHPELDSKPSSSASSNSHLSRKDFSKSDASGRLPFRLVVGGVVLVGIVFGAGIYQFKDSIGGKEPKKEDKVSTKPPSSISIPESKTSSRPSVSRVKNWQRDFDKGLRYLSKKNYEKAIVYLSTSIAEEDDHPEVYHSRGRAYSKTNNFELAEKDFSDALKLNKNDEKILLDRAAAYVYSDNLKKAIKDYSKILRINPSNSKASYGRGLVYVKLKKYRKALSDFEKTIEADPYYVNGYLRIGMIYAAQDQNEKSIESFSKALKYEKRADIFYERALAYYALSKLDEAVSDLTEAIALKSDKKEYYNDRGYVYLKMGKSKNAKKDFESALKIDPQYKLAKENLAKVSDQ